MSYPSPPAEPSLGKLVGEIGEDLSTLFRQEVALAKAEIRQEAAKAGKAAGMLGGAGFAGYMVALLVTLAVVFGLGNVMDLAWAALIVAAVWAVIGGVLFAGQGAHARGEPHARADHRDAEGGRAMGASPEEIRAEIEVTRAELAADVDRLTDRTSPARIVRRRTDRVRHAAQSVREKVMGMPAHATHTVRDQTGEAAGTMRDAAAHAGETVRDAAAQAGDTVRGTAAEAGEMVRHGAQQAAETVRDAPRQAMRGTQGNPLAAGLIAFGAGLLAASLLPKTSAEERAAVQVKDRAGEMVEPVKHAVQETAQRVGEDAREAGQQVRETAADATRTTGEEARDQARQVTEQTRDQARQMTGQARS
ncbi:phage holin family protein [Microbispora sp. CA-102843]|uniref:phage holin family protein n=1 Tax=Microbispora sp. CA-102843 TaxID=3239952 RepID=UPI003D8C3E82